MNKNSVRGFLAGAVVAGALVLFLRWPTAPAPAPIAMPVAATPIPHALSSDTTTNMPPATAPSARADSIDVLAERLKARLEKNPNDMNGWVLLARSYHYLQRWDDAQAAFAKAKSLGYAGEAEPLAADAQMQGGSAAAPEPVFEEVSRVAQQKAAQLQVRSQQ